LQTENFPALLREHQAMVFSIALRIAGDRGAAEEIAQDVFMELHAKLAELATPDHVQNWLRRVASHRSIDWTRRGSSAQEVAMDEATLEAVAEMVEQREPGDPLLNRQLQQLLASLPPLQRSVLVMRYQEDLTPDEISTTLAMPLATVKSHLQRTLKLLRTKAERMLR
jgi:RNA polymerase sigma-70 factor (ECF subfamily)